MPQRNLVKRLSEIALSWISRDLDQFLNAHEPETCKYCKNKYLNENCSYLKQRKERLSHCTDVMKIDIYGKLIRDTVEIPWNFTDYANVFTTEFDTLYFQAWLCDCDRLRIEYKSTGNMEDYHFISKLGKVISSILYNRSSDLVDNKCFVSTLSKATNLRKLVFANTMSITDEIPQTIGKHCHNIREIHGCYGNLGFLKKSVVDSNFTSLNQEIPITCFEKLLFADPERKQILNPCHRTLEILDLNFNDESRDRAPTIFSGNFAMIGSYKHYIFPTEKPRLLEIDSMLNHYLSNIKSFGVFTTIDEIIPRFNVASQLEEATLVTINEGTAEKIRSAFPQLRTIYVNVIDSGTAKNLDLLQQLNLTKLKLILYRNGSMDVQPIYNGIIFNHWSTLRSLEIQDNNYLIGASLSDLNISTLATNLESLEDLSVCYVENVIWDRVSCFKTLKSISIHVKNLDTGIWFKSFANTVKRIKIVSLQDGQLSAKTTSAILNKRYPDLEDFGIFNLTYDYNLMIHFASNCPNLELFRGLASRENENELRDYFKENNYNCKIDDTYDCRAY